MSDTTNEHDDALAARLRRALPKHAVENPPRTGASKRPDPRPLRLAYGAGALSALSLMSVGLVQLSSASTTFEVTPSDGSGADLPPIEVRHVIQYIHLKPGEVAPPGATVITPSAPAPQVVITHVAAPAPQPRRIVVTRQSGLP
jgi:hypothetical protein